MESTSVVLRSVVKLGDMSDKLGERLMPQYLMSPDISGFDDINCIKKSIVFINVRHLV